LSQNYFRALKSYHFLTKKANMKSTKLAVLGFAMLFTLASCVSSKKYNELLDQNQALSKSLAESQELIKVLEAEKAQLMDEKTNLSNDLATAKKDLDAAKSEANKAKQMADAQAAELARVLASVKAAFEIYEKAGLTVTERNGRLYISMPEKVLFPSGSTQLDKKDKSVLETMANVLKSNESLRLMVEGHTDDQPLIAGARYADNWELSVARSVVVVRDLVKRGVKPGQIQAAGSGEFAPVATDNPKSRESRAANRRVEFVLVPDMSEIFRAVKK
jgi:chemotaxis protein MotB